MAARSFFLCILTTLSFAEDCTDRIFLMNFFHLSAAIITVCPRGGIDKMIVKFYVMNTANHLTLSRCFVVRLGGKTISIRVIVDGYQSVGFIFENQSRELFGTNDHAAQLAGREAFAEKNIIRLIEQIKVQDLVFRGRISFLHIGQKGAFLKCFRIGILSPRIVRFKKLSDTA